MDVIVHEHIRLVKLIEDSTTLANSVDSLHTAFATCDSLVQAKQAQNDELVLQRNFRDLQILSYEDKEKRYKKNELSYAKMLKSEGKAGTKKLGIGLGGGFLLGIAVTVLVFVLLR